MFRTLNKENIMKLLQDESGSTSSKRLLGLLCGTVLCVVTIIASVMPTEMAPPEYIINAVALLAFGCLGLTSVDKFKIKNKK